MGYAVVETEPSHLWQKNKAAVDATRLCVIVKFTQGLDLGQNECGGIDEKIISEPAAFACDREGKFLAG